MRVQNEHLARLRLYTGLVLLCVAALLIVTVLWLAGAITIEFKPLKSTGF